jgi:hypothetical protein
VGVIACVPVLSLLALWLALSLAACIGWLLGKNL